MCELLYVESVKVLILPKFIKAQHFKHGGCLLYKERNNIYHMRIFTFKEMSRLQYNVLLGCSTIWRKYGILTRKLWMFIFVVMEMEKLYKHL